MTDHQIVSRDEWLWARKALLIKEKELTRQRDQLAAERRVLPWVKIAKTYVFDTPTGEQTLADLFAGRSQLIVKHFMFGPDWTEGCVGCSFEMDHADGLIVHLQQRDISYVAVSRAPLAMLEAFKTRMGWHFNWVSSHRNDFNYDFHVSFRRDQLADGEVYYNYDMRRLGSEEMSGRSVFYKDADGAIYHTYSSFGRGGEDMLGTYRLLDITPLGRNETGPNHNLTDWVRHHDRYEAGGSVDATGQYRAANEPEDCCRDATAGQSA